MEFQKITSGDACSRDEMDRAAPTLLCEVRQGTRQWKPVRLEDISPTGFRIAWILGCHADTPLRIRIPGMHVLSAQIRWQDGDTLGCEFSQPLNAAVFEYIVRRANCR